MATLYTVVSSDDKEIAYHVTLAQAGRAVLTHGGSTFRIEEKNGVLKLFTNAANNDWGDRHIAFSPRKDPLDAMKEIFERAALTADTEAGWLAEICEDGEYEAELRERIEKAKGEERKNLEWRLKIWRAE